MKLSPQTVAFLVVLIFPACRIQEFVLIKVETKAPKGADKIAEVTEKTLRDMRSDAKVVTERIKEKTTSHTISKPSPKLEDTLETLEEHARVTAEKTRNALETKGEAAETAMHNNSVTVENAVKTNVEAVTKEFGPVKPKDAQEKVVPPSIVLPPQ